MSLQCQWFPPSVAVDTTFVPRFVPPLKIDGVAMQVRSCMPESYTAQYPEPQTSTGWKGLTHVVELDFTGNMSR